jgi:hypothetical protein
MKHDAPIFLMALILILLSLCALAYADQYLCDYQICDLGDGALLTNCRPEVRGTTEHLADVLAHTDGTKAVKFSCGMKNVPVKK